MVNTEGEEVCDVTMDELCNTPFASTPSKLLCTPFKSVPKQALVSSRSSHATVSWPCASSTAVRPTTPSSAKAPLSYNTCHTIQQGTFIKSNKYDKSDVSLQLLKQQEILTNTISGIHDVLKEILSVQRERAEIDRKHLELKMARIHHQ